MSATPASRRERVLIACTFAVLALYLLLRELWSQREWALAGAHFYALTSSVWLHGVWPLSSGPGQEGRAGTATRAPESAA